MVDASTDLFIQDLEAEFGDTGYAFWFKTLELLGSQGDRKGMMDISENVWRQVIHSHRTDHLRKLYAFATDRGKLTVETLPNGLLRVKCRKFAQFADNYTKYNGLSLKRLQRHYKLSESRTEEDIEEKKIVEKKPVEVPEQLKTFPGFNEAWQAWEDYRRTEKKRLTDRSRAMQLKFLATQPNPVAVIETSIRNQWQGLFEVGKKNGTQTAKKPGTSPLMRFGVKP